MLQDRIGSASTSPHCGTSPRDGTKTPSPVTHANAEKLFDSVVASKINDGYRRIDGGAPPLTVSDAGVDANGRDTELLRKLAVCARSACPEKERDRLFWRLGVIRLTAAGNGRGSSRHW